MFIAALFVHSEDLETTQMLMTRSNKLQYIHLMEYHSEIKTTDVHQLLTLNLEIIMLSEEVTIPRPPPKKKKKGIWLSDF